MTYRQYNTIKDPVVPLTLTVAEAQWLLDKLEEDAGWDDGRDSHIRRIIAKLTGDNS